MAVKPATETRPADATDSAPKTQTPTDHAAAAQPETGWHTATVSALCDAEALLDSLEARGFRERELIVLGDSSFAVRWR